MKAKFVGFSFTFEIHAGLQTLPEAAGRTIFPSDLVDDAVIASGTQIVMLSLKYGEHND